MRAKAANGSFSGPVMLDLSLVCPGPYSLELDMPEHGKKEDPFPENMTVLGAYMANAHIVDTVVAVCGSIREGNATLHSLKIIGNAASAKSIGELLDLGAPTLRVLQFDTPRLIGVLQFPRGKVFVAPHLNELQVTFKRPSGNYSYNEYVRDVTGAILAIKGQNWHMPALQLENYVGDAGVFEAVVRQLAQSWLAHKWKRVTGVSTWFVSIRVLLPVYHMTEELVQALLAMGHKITLCIKCDCLISDVTDWAATLNKIMASNPDRHITVSVCEADTERLWAMRESSLYSEEGPDRQRLAEEVNLLENVEWVFGEKAPK
jgi:hypothetical protein